MLLRSEQEPVDYMMDLVSKLPKAVEQRLNTSAGTSGTANKFSQLPKHRRFAICENGSACFQDTPSSLVELYTKHVLSLRSDIARSCQKNSYRLPVTLQTSYTRS